MEYVSFSLIHDYRCTDRPDQHIIAYPLSHGKMVNLVAFTSRHELEGTNFNGPWVCPTEKKEFLSDFRNWEPEVQALLDVSDPHSILRFFRKLG